ncbi:MAG TPA: serine/threonine protein kinase, partial [Polyangiaceae bacterium]|nr:serine/threonine protein kinase [Polyangiaceae bacterium]
APINTAASVDTAAPVNTAPPVDASPAALAALAQISELVTPVAQHALAADYLVTDPHGRVIASSAAHYAGTRLPFGADELARWLFEPRGRLWPARFFTDGKGGRIPFLTISAPVTSQGRDIGGVHLLLPISGRFGEILSLARLGESGETYAFDADARMISESRFGDSLRELGLLKGPSSVLEVRVRDPGVPLGPNEGATLDSATLSPTRSVAQALAGRDGVDVDGYRDYRGISVVGAWHWFPSFGLGVVSEIDVDEAFELRHGLRVVLLCMLGAIFLIAGLNIYFVYRAARIDEGRLRAEKRAERLGQYLLIHKLGEGGMGSVFLARHALLRRPTAVKLIKANPDDPGAAERFQRFEREVQHTAELTHPNTIAVYDYGKTPEGRLYYAMEYLDGVDLDALVRKTGPLPVDRVLYLATQICGSLHEAHSNGVVHRDIKPSNIMVCRRGAEHDRVKVLDFGLAKELGALEAEAHVTREGALSGTPLYMAPELLRGESTMPALADLYALAAVCYYLLAGRELFPRRDAMAVLLAQVGEEPTRLEQLLPQLPEGVAPLIHSALAKDPLRRPPSVRAFLTQLQALVPATWNEDRAAAWWTEHGSTFARSRSSDGRTSGPPADPSRDAPQSVTNDPHQSLTATLTVELDSTRNPSFEDAPV